MSNQTYKPLADRVLVEPQQAETKTTSGIVLPDSAQEKPQTGKVVSVGAGRVSDEGKIIPMTVKEGDVVLYSKYGGTEIKINNADFLIIKEGDILAVQG